MTTVASKMSNKQFTLAVGEIKWLKIKNGPDTRGSALNDDFTGGIAASRRLGLSW